LSLIAELAISVAHGCHPCLYLQIAAGEAAFFITIKHATVG
jgi:hypothetical protein